MRTLTSSSWIFENEGRRIVGEMLDASALKVNSERIKYGITTKQIEEIQYTVNPKTGLRSSSKTQHTEYGMEQTSSSSQGLSAAAALLIQRRNELAQLRSAQQEHVFSVSNPESDTTIEVDAEYHRLEALIDVKQREYELLRAEVERRFPVLAVFTGDEQQEKLAQLAQGPLPAVAALIAQEIADKSANIKQVRDELHPGGGVQI